MFEIFRFLFFSPYHSLKTIQYYFLYSYSSIIRLNNHSIIISMSASAGAATSRRCSSKTTRFIPHAAPLPIPANIWIGSCRSRSRPPRRKRRSNDPPEKPQKRTMAWKHSLPGHFRCKKTTGIAGGYVFFNFPVPEPCFPYSAPR